MLAPPASRAGGASKSPARTRLAEKQFANTSHSLAAAHAGSGDYGGGLIKVAPKGAASAGSGGGGSSGHLHGGVAASKAAAKSATPLHLRMVNDVEFVVFPFSLIFVDPACEMDYLKAATQKVPGNVRRMCAALLLVFGIATAFEAKRYDTALKDSDYAAGTGALYLTRLVLMSICIALTLLFGLGGSRIRIPYHPAPQAAFTILMTAIGSVWAVASVYGNEDLLSKGAELRSVEGGSFLLFLIVMHGLGRFLFFHLSCVSSGLSTIVYVAASITYASDKENGMRVAWACIVAVCGCALCWFVNHRLEKLKRWSHLNCLKVELGRREKADLKKEAFDLRDEMYVMTLERYDIADVQALAAKELEFKSPMEQAMAKLQELSDNKSLPKDAFLSVQKVIGLLGNSSDVFKVQVSSALADKNIRLDDETTRYLFDLVNDNSNYDEAAGANGAGGAGSGGGQQFGLNTNLASPSNNNQTLSQSGMASMDSPAAKAGGGNGGAAKGNISGRGGGGASHTKMLGSGGGDESGAHSERGDRDLSQQRPEISTGGGTLTNVDNTGSTAPYLERTNTRLLTLPGGGTVVPGLISPKEDRALNEILKNMDTYNFDVFDVANLTGGKPLFFVGTALFKKYDLLRKFSIDRAKLSNFLNVIEAGYLRTNPYHNGIHASDVARTVHYFLHTSMKSYTTDLEVLGLIVASLIHDFDHPGRTNQYHITVRDPKAILYNDRAVLENHHVAQSFFLLNRDENNILCELSQKDYAQVRKLIVELVLATDLGAHFDFLAQFKSSLSSGALDSSNDKLAGPNAYANRLMIFKMALKCGDLGHSTKTLPLHEKWTLRITEEFYRQGDEERRRKIQISPFMDRQKANLPQSQVGFLDFLVIPMFTIWVKFLELDDAKCPLMEQLKSNKEHWKGQLEQVKEPLPGAVPVSSRRSTEERKTEVASSGSGGVEGSPKVVPVVRT